MRTIIFFLLIGLTACADSNVDKIVLPDSAVYTIKEGSTIYGQFKTSPNNGYVITKSFSEVSEAYSGQVNWTVNLIGIYSAKGDQLHLTNQELSKIQLFNRWGEELTPTNEDMERISSLYSHPETFTVTVADKVLIKS